ncbi:MAG: hypothetical protein NTY19_07710 [Planctomycetota bacterium]|nr:hypothetical protein [Planctomycetota bacterium]
MAAARLMIDSDVFVLLSGAGLLDRVLTLVGFGRGMALRLDPLPHMLRRSRKFLQLCQPQTRDRALAACKTVPAVTDRPADQLHQRLIDFREIDGGEALLYALLVEQPTYLLASGDKRAMLTIAGAPELHDIRDCIAGRVICLETVLRLLVMADGAVATASAFSVFPDHKTMQVIFSEVNFSDQEKCLASLDSYLRNLKRTVGADFLYEP